MIATAQFTISIVNDGVGIVENVIEYCISTSGTIVPGSPLTDGSGNIIYDVNGLILTDGAWSSTMPQSTDGDYIWTRSKTVYSDGNFALAYMVSHHGEDGAVGATGVSVVKVTPEYRLSDSSTSLTGTGDGYSWSTSKPNVESGQFIWERQKTDLSDGTAVYSDAVCDIVMSGLVFDVDKANKSIEQKVWASDITNSINSYDGTTGVAIRDQVAQHTQTLNGFETRISANETTLSTKADGSTVTNLSSQVNNISDTVDGHTQSISATNTRIDNLKLGTKNYIQNSDFFDKTKAPYTTSTASGPQSSPAAKDGQAAYNTGSGGKIIVTFPQLVSGKEYVFSFDWNRPYTAQTIRTTIGGTNYDETTVNDAVWHRKEIKFTANANTTEAQIYINQSGASYTLYVRHFQLELGNIASDWHESPEDVEAEITSVKTTAEQTADHLSWVIEESGKTASTFTFKSRVMSLINADLVIKDPAGSSTIISGGKINANSITTNMLASNAIKSINYISGSSTDVPNVVSQDIPARYSTTGTFLDLSSGALYMPNFNVDSSGQVFMNGTVYANAGQIGDPGNAYWEIGTIYDNDWGDHAGLIAHGDAIIQADKLTLSDNRLNSENQGNYIAYNNKWYDFGFQVPDFTTNNTHRDNVFYIRSINQQPTSATLDSDWTYLFRVDKNGDIFWNGHDISQGTFVPLSGGVTMTGSLTVPTLTVTGTLTATASAAQKLTPGKTIQTNLASTSAVTFTGESNVTPGVTGTLGVGNGGTGATTFTSGAALIGNGTGAIQTRTIRNNTTAGALGWTANTTDTTLVTTNTIAYWDGRYRTTDNGSNLEYVKLGKLGTVVTHAFDEFITTSGGIIDGSLSVTELTAGNLIVTGAGRFTNGLYGDLIGNATTATTATQVGNNLKIQLNGGTTEGTNQFTYNGSAAKNINITKSSVGLGNVENTALSTWAGSSNLTTTKVGTLAGAAIKAVDTSISASSTSANLPTSAAVASFVEGKGYVTSSGVTSVQVQATSPVVSSTNTAQSSTLNTTISLANAYGDTKNPYGTKTANYVLAGPSSGSAAAPTFRALVAADIPSITKSKISDFPTTWALTNITGADDLKAIEGLTGTSGMLKKTAANTWALTTVVSGISINNDVITVSKSDGTSSDLTINITGQVVSGATILSDAQGNAISLGSASAPVYFSNGVPSQANTIPTIALNGSNTTSPSFYAPTGAGTNNQYLKSNGSGAPTWATFSKSTVGLGNVDNTADANKNVLTATKFASAQSVTLTGDTTGTASSQAGWSIATTTKLFTGTLESATALTTSPTAGKIRYSYNVNNGTTGLFNHSSNANSIITLNRHNGNYDSQIGFSSDGNIYYRSFNGSALNNTTAWKTMLDSSNYTSYTVEKDGTGATGTWGISITGNAATATKWASAQTVYVALGTASTTTTLQGGSSSASTIGVNGTLGVGNGGTGKASWTQYGIVYASTTSALSQIGTGTSGQVLTSGGSAAPAWVNQSTLSVGSATNATNATKATQDGSGNTITSYYCTLSTAQTLSGAKTFSAATSFTNTTASTNKSTGAVKVSGGLGVAGRAASNEVEIGDKVVLSYNTTTQSLDFTFV